MDQVKVTTEGSFDLYLEDFDPRLNPADYAQFTTGPADMPEEVLRETSAD